MAARTVSIAALLALLLVRASHAQERPPRLLLLEPLPEGAHARIDGQSSDLALELLRVPSASGSDPLARAAASVEEHDARAALWIEEPAGELALFVYDPKARRMFERRFEVGQGLKARSAALEALALSARSVLQALAEDEPFGEALPGAVSEAPGDAGTGGTSGTPPTDTSTPPTPTTSATTKEGETARERSQSGESAEGSLEATEDETGGGEDEGAGGGGSLALVLAAGWDAALDGQSPTGQQGPVARVGVDFGPVELGVQLQTALPATLRDDNTRLRLVRKLALARIGVELIGQEPFELAVGAFGGVASYRRRTLAVGVGLEKTDPEDKSAGAFGVELRGALQLVAGASLSLALELALSALCVPAAPDLRYRTASGQLHARALWPVEPSLQLGPRLRWQP